MGKNFVHLHLHADTSILDGFSKLPEYIKRVKELGQPGLGLTDHGNVASVYTLIKESRENGITPIPGCEMYVAPQNPEGARAKKPVFYGKNGQKAPQYDVSSNGAYTHQTMWAINNTGLKNLFKLSTLSYQRENVYQKPRIDFDMLAEHSEGIVIATGCPSSEISTRFLLDQDKKAYEYAGRLKEIFGDRMFVEIMEHNMSIPLERLLLPKQMELAKKLNLPLLATNDAHYANKEDSIHHEELLAAQSGSKMTDLTFDEGGSRFAFEGNEYYVKSTEEMLNIFPDEDYPGAISNTLLIAEMALDVSFDYDPTLRPHAVVPDGMTPVEYFKQLINEGFKERYGSADKDIRDEALQRISEEFEVIHSSDFVGYFLTVYEYLNWTREKFSTRDDKGNILAPSTGVGRGSVGGSIIAYLLKISELDPIKHDLLFERFLSAGRGDTYRIEYDDGTFEDVIVSEKRHTSGQDLYIHELRVGDVVEVNDSITLQTQADSVEQPKVDETKDDDKTIADNEPAAKTESPAVSKRIEKDKKENEEFVLTEEILAKYGFDENELTDLAEIAF